MRGDPLEQLEGSHRRHDEQMARLVDAAARLADGRPAPDDLDTIAEVIGFLERAVPRHFADEEQSLFPRLVARAPGLAEPLARIAAEHRDHERQHRVVRSLWEVLEGEPAAAAALLDAARALEDAHRRHVDEEDRLFGQARALLDAADLAAMTTEMEGRRGGRGRGERR